MDRKECTDTILQAKEGRGASFADIASHVGRSEVWTAAAILGQARLDEDEAAALAEFLALGPEIESALQQHPMRGSLDTQVPVDPLLYRFHEITQVFGTTIKALINEKFGDGIMSAIDFEMDIERVADPKGDRVRVTYNGKFLPYRKW